MSAASRLFLVVVLGYALSSASMHPWVRVLLALLSSLGLHPRVCANANAHRLVLSALTGALGFSALLAWTAAPNHHWVMCYASLAFALHARGGEEDELALRKSFALLLSALMGLAVLQKLLSATYLDGSYFTHIIDTGALGGPAFSWCSACEARATSNVDAIIAFVEDPPLAGAQLAMTPVIGEDARGVWELGRALAAGVLGFEIWLACVYALAWRHVAAPVSILAFASGLALMRAEWVFGALVCAMAFAASEPEKRRLRRALLTASSAFMALRLMSMLLDG